MAPNRPQLLIFFAKSGKALRAQCSVCRVRAKRRNTKDNDGKKLIEIYCPECQSTLFVASNVAEIRRSLARAAALVRE